MGSVEQREHNVRRQEKRPQEPQQPRQKNGEADSKRDVFRSVVPDESSSKGHQERQFYDYGIGRKNVLRILWKRHSVEALLWPCEKRRSFMPETARALLSGVSLWPDYLPGTSHAIAGR